MSSKKLGFTLVTLTSYGRVGVILSGGTIRSEPKLFSTEAGAIEHIVNHYRSATDTIVLRFDETCSLYQSKRATFNRSEFHQKVIDSVRGKEGIRRSAEYRST